MVLMLLVLLFVRPYEMGLLGDANGELGFKLLRLLLFLFLGELYLEKDGDGR